MNKATEEDIEGELVSAHLIVNVTDKACKEHSLRPARAVAAQVLESTKYSPTAEAALFELKRYAEKGGAKVESIHVSAILSFPNSEWPVAVSIKVDEPE